MPVAGFLNSGEKRSRNLSPTSWTFSAIELRVSSPLAGANRIPRPIPRPIPAAKLIALFIVGSSCLRMARPARSDWPRKSRPIFDRDLRNLFTNTSKLKPSLSPRLSTTAVPSASSIHRNRSSPNEKDKSPVPFSKLENLPRRWGFYLLSILCIIRSAKIHGTAKSVRGLRIARAPRGMFSLELCLHFLEFVYLLLVFLGCLFRGLRTIYPVALTTAVDQHHWTTLR